jgi:Peptidase family S41
MMRPAAFLAVIACAAVPPASGAQSASTPGPAVTSVVPADALRNDLLVARTALEELQPSLHRYAPKPEIDDAFDHAYAALDHGMTPLDAYPIFAETAAAIGDGHTRFSLPSAVAATARAKLFPLDLVFVNGRAYVRDGSDTVPRGAEVRSIGGRPITSIVAAIFAHLSADGGSTAAKYARLQYAFATDYALYVGRPETFDVELSERGGRRTVRLAAVSDRARPSAPSSPKPPLRLTVDAPHRLAIMTVETFDDDTIAAARENFPAFVDGAFSKIEKLGVRDLIIDMRGNDGGNPYAPLLFSYVAEKPFRVFDHVTASSRDLLFARSYSHLGAEFLRTFAARLRPAANGTFAAVQGPDIPLTEQRPHSHAYRGRLWIVIDGDVFSMAAEFCALVRANGRGRFVGTETGGAMEGYTGIDFVALTLPATKIRLLIPLLKTVIAEPRGAHFPRRGIVPDDVVTPTVRGLLEGRDEILAATLHLIEAPAARSSARSRRFATLPLSSRGSASVTEYVRGTLKPASAVRSSARMASTSRTAPASGCSTAWSRSPYSGSGSPTTAQSRTPGTRKSACSISAG